MPRRPCDAILDLAPLGLADRSGALRITCPDGYLPRAALGALIAPLFVTLEGIGMLPDASGWLADAQTQLAVRRNACAPGVAGQANPAREIARRMSPQLPTRPPRA